MFFLGVKTSPNLLWSCIKLGASDLIEETESHIVIRLLLGLLLLLLGLLGGSGTTGSGGSSSGSTTSGDGSELGGTLSDELEERLKKSHG